MLVTTGFFCNITSPVWKDLPDDKTPNEKFSGSRLYGYGAFPKKPEKIN